MTALTVRADKLIMAFEDQSAEMQHYFDRQTGEVLTVFADDMDEEDAQRLEAAPDRYLLIEPVPSWTGYDIMSDFVETLPEGKVQWELDRALRKNRPFRGFKDVLLNYPSVEEDWFRFHEQAFIKIIKEWLEDHGVEATLFPATHNHNFLATLS
ncbi:MAG: hypothetical protein HY790_05365 [Deltaproteobacteria bacterium]|nr:hypothetical protein [Deltaproteobacteria bacterium]MBI4795256.1 hypothetical protein [Deltaproteobacteria bacterium]